MGQLQQGQSIEGDRRCSRYQGRVHPPGGAEMRSSAVVHHDRRAGSDEDSKGINTEELTGGTKKDSNVTERPSSRADDRRRGERMTEVGWVLRECVVAVSMPWEANERTTTKTPGWIQAVAGARSLRTAVQGAEERDTPERATKEQTIEAERRTDDGEGKERQAGWGRRDGARPA